jgi:hypothetical protein
MNDKSTVSPPMSERWFVQIYEELEGEYRYTGANFEFGHLGHLMPVAGDVIISPDRKSGFADPRDLSIHEAYEVIRRYVVPDIKENKFLMMRVLVKRRPLTVAEAGMF